LFLLASSTVLDWLHFGCSAQVEHPAARGRQHKDPASQVGAYLCGEHAPEV
jgi:hypothetical protein